MKAGLISCTLCLFFFASGACKPKPEADRAAPPSPPGEGPAENQTANTLSTPGLDLATLAKDTGPAVILVSVFDSSGNLTTTGTGFFVADNGRFVTSARLIAGGVNAVAKTADGKIYNVAGILAASSALDLAVLKADAKSVPFLPLNPAAPQPGAHVAVIGSPLKNNARPPLTATIKRSEVNEDWLEVAPPLAKDVIGFPVVDGNGEVLGIVTLASEEAPGVVRTSAAQSQLLASIVPNAIARWPGSPSPSALAQKPTPKPAAGRVVYKAPPIYPAQARSSNPPIKGSGRFRIVFSAAGEAQQVQITRSTGNALLDGAATAALSQWKATPGREWSINVPVTFAPR